MIGLVVVLSAWVFLLQVRHNRISRMISDNYSVCFAACSDAQASDHEYRAGRLSAYAECSKIVEEGWRK